MTFIHHNCSDMSDPVMKLSDIISLFDLGLTLEMLDFAFHVGSIIYLNLCQTFGNALEKRTVHQALMCYLNDVYLIIYMNHMVHIFSLVHQNSDYIIN